MGTYFAALAAPARLQLFTRTRSVPPVVEAVVDRVAAFCFVVAFVSPVPSHTKLSLFLLFVEVYLSPLAALNLESVSAAERRGRLARAARCSLFCSFCSLHALICYVSVSSVHVVARIQTLDSLLALLAFIFGLVCHLFWRVRFCLRAISCSLCLFPFDYLPVSRPDCSSCAIAAQPRSPRRHHPLHCLRPAALRA